MHFIIEHNIDFKIWVGLSYFDVWINDLKCEKWFKMKSRFLCPKLSKANGNHVQYFNVCSLHSYYLCALIICIALNVAVCRLAAKLITILYSGLSAKQSFVDVVNYMLIWREREREKTIYISGKMLAYSSQCTWIDFVSISETHTSCICNGLHGRNEPALNFPTQPTRNNVYTCRNRIAVKCVYCTLAAACMK